MKEARCLFRDVFQNSVLKILTAKNIKVLILVHFRSLAEQIILRIIDFEVLVMAGLVSKNALVKILGKGTLERKLEVHAHAFSKSAVEAIEAKKGTAVIL